MILSNYTEIENANAGTHRFNGPQDPNTPLPPELRGDVATHGLWRRGTFLAIFDIRVTDTDAPASNRGLDPAKILKKHEKEKQAKYLEACLARRYHFTPLVFSVDGL
jgi:hypothetical protein